MIKRINLSVLGLLAAGFVGLASTAQAGAIYDSLTDAEKKIIGKGEQVTRTEEVEGSVWPTVVVYQAVKATPEQVAAVMFDYPLHQTMFSKEVSAGRREGVIRSVPKTAGAIDTEIEYTMNFPKVMGITLPDEHYSVRNQLATLGSDGYQISWTFIKATSMKDCSGSSKFEKLGNETLVAYTNFINPPRPSVAKLIKKMAISRVQETVKQLSDQTAAEISGNPAQLQAQLAVLKKALGQ
jgi:hypothetical protein